MWIPFEQAVLSGHQDVRAGTLTEQTLQLAAELLPREGAGVFDVSDVLMQTEVLDEAVEAAATAAPDTARQSADTSDLPLTVDHADVTGTCVVCII